MDEFSVQQRPLPYAGRLDARDLASIDGVVIHCTELPDLDEARSYGERVHYARSGTGNSGHFYIDRDGRMEQWVPLERVAHHVRDHNATTIGIELVNRGRFPHWLRSDHQAMQERYTAEQVNALISLLNQLQRTLPGLARIAGHEDLDQAQVPAEDDPSVRVFRKRDPGPHFPWARILDATGLLRFP